MFMINNDIVNANRVLLHLLNARLVQDPNDISALLKRINVNEQLHHYREMIADCDQVLSLAPALMIILRNRAHAKQMLNAHKEALMDFNIYLQSVPNDVVALCYRGDLKRVLGSFYDALKDLDAALYYEPSNAFALSIRGETKRLLGDYHGALFDLDKSLLKSTSANTFALRSRGETLWALKDHQGALMDFEQYLQQVPNDRMVLENRHKIIEIIKGQERGERERHFNNGEEKFVTKCRQPNSSVTDPLSATMIDASSDGKKAIPAIPVATYSPYWLFPANGVRLTSQHNRVNSSVLKV